MKILISYVCLRECSNYSYFQFYTLAPLIHLNWTKTLKSKAATGGNLATGYQFEPLIFLDSSYVTSIQKNTCLPICL